MKHHKSEIRVCIDVGSQEHYVAVGLSTGERLEEFKLTHTPEGIRTFFQKLEALKADHNLPVVIGMEAYNGYARPIDQEALSRGYQVFNVNNHKLARFKECFPGPAKSDPIDAWKMFELFKMKDSLPLSRAAIQEVQAIPEGNKKLKRLTRRRAVLVEEKVRILNRMQSDLHAISPGLLEIAGEAGNLWFLNLLTARPNLPQLSRLKYHSLLKIKGVGRVYAEKIRQWQKDAHFSEEASYAGEMVINDAKRVLQLLGEIHRFEAQIRELAEHSEIATRLMSIPGFGLICAAEIAAELGSLSRFSSESSLALYSGMVALTHSSGKQHGTRTTRQVNSRVKRALMVGVFRHTACVEESRVYYEKKRQEGKRHNQALRSLGRHFVRIIWSMLVNARDYELRVPQSKIHDLPLDEPMLGEAMSI